jgi:hypothetical protein
MGGTALVRVKSSEEVGGGVRRTAREAKRSGEAKK